jgi:hypothetical protein
MLCGEGVVISRLDEALAHSCCLHSRIAGAQRSPMKKLGKDLLMFAEACRTRAFRRDLAFTMVVPALVALLYFEAQSDFEVALVWWLFVAAVLWFPWYALTTGYVPYVYGAPRRFTVSSWDDSKRFRYVRGYLEDESLRYSLICNRRLVVKPGDRFFVLKHPYRNRIAFISRYFAERHGQADRFDAMRGGPVPIYYEDFVQLG